MDTLEKYKDQFIVFIEAGFIATNMADQANAVKLFRAAELLDGQSPLPHIGMGYLHLLKLELPQAAAAFETLLKKNPDDVMAKTFLGLVFAMTPDKVAQGEKLLTEVTQQSDDPMIKSLADSSLVFLDKFIKKAPTPAGGLHASANKSKSIAEKGLKPGQQKK